MVSMLTSIAVDWVKPKIIKLGFAASPLSSTQYYGIRAKIVWLGIRIMCPSGAKCLYPRTISVN
jgi:hypothetical protein